MRATCPHNFDVVGASPPKFGLSNQTKKNSIDSVNVVLFCT